MILVIITSIVIRVMVNINDNPGSGFKSVGKRNIKLKLVKVVMSAVVLVLILLLNHYNFDCYRIKLRKINLKTFIFKI